MKQERLSTAKVWGFSVGTLGEYFVYYLFYTYFMYYLTDYVHLSAAVAGGIMSIAMIWDAFTDPVVGYVNDTSKNPKGRRRPMMLKAFIPFCICFVLCFIRPGLEGNALNIYYGVVWRAFLLCFTTDQVPFYGLLPEITKNDEDRMRIRAAMGFIGNVGNLAVAVVPVALSLVISLGADEMIAWSITMGVLGVIGGAGFLVTYAVTKGMETPQEHVIRPKENILKTYAQIIKLKGYIPVVIVYILCTIDLTLMFASIMYVADSKLGLDAGLQYIITACYTFSGAIFVILVTPMNKRFGSYKSLQIVMIVGAVLFIACGVIGINNAGIMIFHGLVTGGTFALATAFTYGLLYQVIDVACLKTEEQVEGSVISFATLGYKLGAAISASLLGVALTIIGYDGASEMNAEVLGRIDSLLTYMPAVLLVLSVIILKFLYPIREDLYRKIVVEKEKKMNGEDYSVEEFKHLM